MSPPRPNTDNRRILIIDDNPEIHADIAKVLASAVENSRSPVDAHAAAFFGCTSLLPAGRAVQPFELHSAFQGEEGFAAASAAAAAGRPFAAAIVDGRMPPGWDGIQTIKRLWEICPDLQILICTAHADYTWEQIMDVLGGHDNLMILKKPFEVIEVQQITEAMARRWNNNHRAHLQIEELARLVWSVRDPDVPAGFQPDLLRSLPPSATPASPDRHELVVENSKALVRELDARLRDSKAAIVGRLAASIRPHHSQLGAFGRKLPDFLAQLATGLEHERVVLTQLVASLQRNLERLRPSAPGGAGGSRSPHPAPADPGRAANARPVA